MNYIFHSAEYFPFFYIELQTTNFYLKNRQLDYLTKWAKKNSKASTCHKIQKQYVAKILNRVTILKTDIINPYPAGTESD